MAHTFSVCRKCESLNKVDSQKALQKAPACGKCGESLPMHGLVSEVSAEGFKKLLAKSDQPVIADFWASWCGPCRAYAPNFEDASKRLQNAVFVKINTETEQRLSAELGVRGIPTTIVFKNGREVRRQPGVIPGEAIGQLLV
jgi:thioredoxin 2